MSKLSFLHYVCPRGCRTEWDAALGVDGGSRLPTLSPKEGTDASLHHGFLWADRTPWSRRALAAHEPAPARGPELVRSTAAHPASDLLTSHSASCQWPGDVL